jgi:YD repeat-containing protein
MTRTSTIVRDIDGYIGSVTNPIGQVESYSYDAAGRVITKTFSDGVFVQYGHDRGGNVTEVIPPGRPVHSIAFELLGLTSSYAPPQAARNLAFRNTAMTSTTS